MTDSLDLNTLAQEISLIRSSLLLTSWTIEAINEGEIPESKKRSELFEGLSFILDNLAEKLAGLYRSVNVE